MPQVLIVGLNYAPEPTGIAPYTTGLAAGLQERGHAVRVLTTFPHYPAWQIADEWNGRKVRRNHLGVDVTHLRHYVPARPTGMRRAISELSFAARAVGHTWGRPDVIVCPSPALLATSVALARARTGLERPALGVIAQDLYSAGITESGSGGAAVTRMLTALERRTLRGADGVVAIHPRHRAKIVGGLDVDPAAVRVIRNWTHMTSAEGADRGAIRAWYGWRPYEFVVMHTGAMGEKQALSNVVEAARLAGARSGQVRFVLVGDGGQRAQLERQATGVGNLAFLDPVASSEYAGLLAAADVLLVNERPGVTDMAVPSKLTSYFSSGVPVLAACGPSSTTADEVEASGAGTRVDPGDPAALLRGVLDLSADPKGLREQGARGPAYCASVLSEKNALDAYASWVEQLATSRMTRGSK